MFNLPYKQLAWALLFGVTGSAFGEGGSSSLDKIDTINNASKKQSAPQECGKTDTLPLSRSTLLPTDVLMSKPKTADGYTLTRQMKQRTEACYISPDAANTAMGKGASVVVDVRAPSSFAKYRIANSLNMPLHAIRTKNFLKNSSVILVNEGRDTAPLDAACQDLRRAGFSSVSILDGGLHAWHQKAGNLVGDVISQKDLDTMKPAELFEEIAYSDWIIADFSGVAKGEVAKYWPQSVPMNLAKDEKRFIAEYKQLLSQRHKSNARIVLVTRRGEEYDKLSNWLRRAGESQPLFLEGGYDGYKQFAQSQVAIWNRVDNPPRRKGCNT
jgi:rhodanese-related sulfurtransferase